MHSIFEEIHIQQKQNLPFVIYRKPDSKNIVGIFQQDDHLYFSDNLREKAFVFAPFSGLPIIFPLDKSRVKYNSVYFKNTFKINESNVENLFSETEKNQFKELVQKCIAVINEGVFNKIVISRKEVIKLNEFDLEKVFQKVLYKYPNAFCYCWSHPKVGMWIGATPEKLFSAKENSFQTMSLAGTQSYKGTENVVWKSKERNEQEYVTKFILNQLKKEVDSITKSDSYTTRAGNLLHLRTDIQGELKPNSELKKCIDILHPTPAVCGLPKDLAKVFIEENEGYNREFYTGYLGEINYDFNTNVMATNLFVNLRCMKITNHQANIFVGCGITKDSNPEAEWEETVNKSKTMKQVL